MSATPSGEYADINGLHLYYEIHGAPRPNTRPLVLLHGGFMSASMMAPLPTLFAQTRQVIAVDLEGHGHTADLDRPLSANQMAQDVSGLIAHLGIPSADVCGFSLGGNVALRLAMLRPELLHQLVLISAVYHNDGYYPATTVGWPQMSPEMMAGSPPAQIYAIEAPDPDHWPIFIAKMSQLMINFPGWPEAEIQRMTTPTLILQGDSDLVQPEHSVALFRMLGGARPDGGMAGVTASQMALLPATTHFTILDRTDLLLPIIVPFLDGEQESARNSDSDEE